jgi:putative tryptophan/tyrosine transport system substrate-binding protein
MGRRSRAGGKPTKARRRKTVTRKRRNALKATRARNIEFSIHPVARAEEIAAGIDSAQASGAAALNIWA